MGLLYFYLRERIGRFYVFREIQVQQFKNADVVWEGAKGNE